MQSVFEAAGGIDGLRCLADAWNRRVVADDVVVHAFSHGFHPSMSSGSPLIGLRHSAARPRIPIPMVTRPPSSKCTAGTERA
ncbi:MAG TPA: hypothetical protein VIX90_17540 [Edaphobacter sp.]